MVQLALKQLAVYLEAVAEEDHDQRHVRDLVYQPGARFEVEHAGCTVAEDEPREHRQRRERERAAPRQTREQRAQDEQSAEHGCARLKRGHSGSVSYVSYG